MDQNSCNQCSNQCYACFGESQCSECPQSSYLVNYKLKKFALLKRIQSQKTGNCLDTCPEGTFQSQFFSQCQECSIKNCQRCSSPNTCSLCKQGWVLSQDHTSCLQDQCFQNQNYVYNPDLQKCQTYCPQDEDKQNKICSSYFQIGYTQSSVIPSNLYKNCVIVKFIVFQLKQKQQIAALCQDQIILYSYDELQPYYTFKISGIVQDATYFEDVMYILIESSTTQIVTFDTQNVFIEYFDTQSQCNSQIYNNQYLFCRSEITIEQNIFAMVDIFTLKSYQFQSDNSNIELINSLQQSTLNNGRILKINDTSLTKVETQNLKRNLQDDSLNYEPEPYNQNMLLIPFDIPLIRVLPSNQTSTQSQYYYQVFLQINKVIGFSNQDNNFYYFNLTTLNQPLLAVNIPNSGGIICESVYGNTPIFIMSQQQDNYYSYFSSISFNMTSQQYQLNNFTQLDYSQGNLEQCYIDITLQIVILSNQQGCQIYNLLDLINNVQNAQIQTYNFTRKDNIIIEQQVLITQKFIATIITNEKNNELRIINFDQRGFQTDNIVPFELLINYIGQTEYLTQVIYDSINQRIYISNQKEIQMIPLDQTKQRAYASVEGRQATIGQLSPLLSTGVQYLQ
ncbi:hypothetical protein TTHERM_01362530 (macronuclear) [Tetrahymena thermophila SB210]|uniref:R-spondin Fu-CRD domain-containing protein n=1 Tax=Tetrahymena thermophila (strain SB210) TaxID=312017 RepID=Q229N7_TETTS|nr:hypothetical protein TTHERM_01362530 [Tetrahymena thermophila SB210]EAR82001.2 hypothetical protein TTHERM_01362530 [Tetrahymena thermophila SB210]|eukprot:XP_001029664.2 hypothetical protein TTHERM_01362530 [Tetrahymena thermophila SB210]